MSCPRGEALQPSRMSVFTLHFIYAFVLGIVTDQTNVQDPLFVCEHTALDQLVTGLMEPCQCGQVKWVTSSRKQVKKKRENFL